MADLVKVFLHGLSVLLSDAIEDVSYFMSPAALQSNMGIHKGQCSQEALSAIGDDQFQGLCPKPSTVQIREEYFPGSLALGMSDSKIQDLPFPFRSDAQSHQNDALDRPNPSLSFV